MPAPSYVLAIFSIASACVTALDLAQQPLTHPCELRTPVEVAEDGLLKRPNLHGHDAPPAMLW
jgi:hypothetical protein